MNVLYEPLPTCTTVKGQSFEVVTDFRAWLKLIDLSSSQELTEDDKAYLYKEWYISDYPQNMDDLLIGLARFLTMEDARDKPQANNKGAPKKQKQTLSYSLDAPFIVSAFLEVYGIDLLDSQTEMHWWRFCMLLDGLPDTTELQKRRAYRAIDISEIKDRKEKARIKKIQNAIAIPQGEMSDFDIGNAF